MFTLKPPPFKTKAKKIQMKKISLTKIKDGYDYGLHNNEELVIKSTLGSYDHYFTEEKKPKTNFHGEYVEDVGEL